MGRLNDPSRVRAGTADNQSDATLTNHLSFFPLAENLPVSPKKPPPFFHEHQLHTFITGSSKLVDEN